MIPRKATLTTLILLALVAGPAASMEGDMLWEHSYGGSAQDWGYDVKITDDGGFIITGYTKSFGVSGSDVYLVKLDAAGTLQWDTPLGSAANDVGEAVIQTSDGGYLVAGNRNIGTTYSNSNHSKSTGIYRMRVGSYHHSTRKSIVFKNHLMYDPSTRFPKTNSILIRNRF